MMVDHDGAGGGKINETKYPVDELFIVHIPDNIPGSPPHDRGYGCISPMVASYLQHLNL